MTDGAWTMASNGQSPTYTDAIVLHGPRDLRLESHQVSPPLPHEVQVRVLRVGLCGSDQHYYQHFCNGPFCAKEPLCLGHEAAGVVTSIGSSVTHLQPGDRVALEVGVSCGDCEYCLVPQQASCHGNTTGDKMLAGMPTPEMSRVNSEVDMAALNSTSKPSIQTSTAPDGKPRYNLCPNVRFRSSAASFPHYQGTLQGIVNHPAAWVYRLPSHISLDIGALLEPLSVALHAAKRSRMTGGENILVLGAGAVGLLCAWVAKRKGAKSVTIADVKGERVDWAVRRGWAEEGVVVENIPTIDSVESRFAAAKQLAEKLKTPSRPSPRKGHGFGWITPSESGSDDEMGGFEQGFSSREAVSRLNSGATYAYDLVFECTGSEACVQTGIYAAKAGGRVMLVGMGTPTQTLPLGAAALREVDLCGVFRYAGTYPEGIEMVSQRQEGVPDLTDLVTHRVDGLEEVEKGFEMAGAMSCGSDVVLKVMVSLGQEDG